MAFEIIQGFNNSQNGPLDLKFIATSEADMLAIKWVYKGLLTARIDTSPISLWMCDVTAATQPGTPAYTLIGEWTEFTGTVGADGADGSQIYVAAGTPSDVLGENGDFYLNSSSGDYYTKAAGTWGSIQGNLKGPTGATGATGAAGAAGDRYATVSTSSVDLTAAAGTEIITVGLTLSYTVGQEVIVADQTAPLVDNFTGTVTAYNPATGVMSLGSVTYNGSGTLSDWAVNLTGSPGAAGADGADGSNGTPGIALIHTEYDITLDEAKITTVQGGAWTPEAPWSASVQVDSRANKNSPSGIIGDQAKNSITYNGTVWSNNGRWVGQDGSNGTNGDTPYIQAGNWWIDGVDTGVAATGPAGANGEGIVVYNHFVNSNITESQFLALPYDFTVPCELNLLVMRSYYVTLPNLNTTSNIKLRSVRMSSYSPRTVLYNTTGFQVKGRYDGDGLQTYGASEIKGNDIWVHGGESATFKSVIESGTTYADYWLAETSGVGLAHNINGGPRDILGSVSVRLGDGNIIKGLLNFTVNNNVCHYGGWIQVHTANGGARVFDTFGLSESPLAFLPDPRAGGIFNDSTGIGPGTKLYMPLTVNGAQEMFLDFSTGYLASPHFTAQTDCMVRLLWDSTESLLANRVRVQGIINNSLANSNKKYTFGGSYITATPYTIDRFYL